MIAARIATTLGDITESANPGFASGENLRSGVAQLRMNNVRRDGTLDWSDIRRVSADTRKLEKYSLRPGDIVFNSTNSPDLVGKTALFSGFKEPVLFSNHFLRLRVDATRAAPGFIAWWLTHRWQQRAFENLCTRWVNQASVRKEDLLELRIVIPDLSEQKRIARLLEQADRLRRTRRYVLKLSDTFLPAAFLELFGDPLTNPEATPVVELGQFLGFVTSGARGWAEHYVVEGSRFIRSLDVRMNFISDEDAAFVMPPAGAEANRTRVRTDDVLLTITGSQIGRVAPVPARLNGAYISQHVAILRLKPGVLPVFLSWYLSLNCGGQREIARLQYGQTKPGLNFDQIREFRIPLPSVERQQRFAALVARHERLRAGQQEALRQAEHMFQSLLRCAFTAGV